MPITEQDLLDNVIPEPQGDVPAPSPQGESEQAQETPTEPGTGDTPTPTEPPHSVIEAIRKDLTSKWRETKSALEEERAKLATYEAENARLKAIEEEHKQAQEAYRTLLAEREERERNEVAGRAQLRALYGQLQQAQKDGRIDTALTPDDLQQIAVNEWQRHQQAQAIQLQRNMSPEQIAHLAARQTMSMLEERDAARARAEQERLAKEQVQAVEGAFKADFDAVVRTMPGAAAHEAELRALYEATGKKPSDFYAPAVNASVIAKKAENAAKAVPVVSGGRSAKIDSAPWGDSKPLPLRERMTQLLKQADARR